MSKKELVSVYYGGTNEIFTPQPFRVGSGKVLRCYLEDVEPVDDNQLEPVSTLLEMLDRLDDKELYEVQQSKEAKSLVELLLKRKADEKKRKFVEAAIDVWQLSSSKATHESAEVLISDLYDAGCRFIENKAAS